MSPPQPVILESPYGSDDPGIIARNVRYLRACMRDSLLRDEAPYASHGLYTQPGVLRDDVHKEREMGIEAGFAWRFVMGVRKTVVYQDLGTTRGMTRGVHNALKNFHTIEYRKIGGEWPREHVWNYDAFCRACGVQEWSSERECEGE